MQSGFEEVVPIEVKSGDNVRPTSLRRFMQRAQTPFGVRVSAKNFGFEDRVFSVPLYAMFCLSRDMTV
ncbi:hypothetical protein [Bifidobacterium gallicum]|nr:hypothetical protein [Bifidobacterium gallicum]